MKLLGVLGSALAGFWLSSAGAAPMATVERVQSPAWLERTGTSEPLSPGMSLNAGDRIRSGNDARVYLKLAEGSRIKIGADANLVFQSGEIRPDSSFAAKLDVLTGAFRFTTDVLQRLRFKRDLNIRVATATIGIRGTDVWGKAADDADLVALIEGRIELARAGKVINIKSGQYMDAPRRGEAQLRVLDQATLARLAPQTEINSDHGISGARGRWTVLVATEPDQATALAVYDAVRFNGFAAVIHPRQRTPSDGEVAGNRWVYEVRLNGFASKSAAESEAERVKRSGQGARVVSAI